MSPVVGWSHPIRGAMLGYGGNCKLIASVLAGQQHFHVEPKEMSYFQVTPHSMVLERIELDQTQCVLPIFLCKTEADFVTDCHPPIFVLVGPGNLGSLCACCCRKQCHYYMSAIGI